MQGLTGTSTVRETDRGQTEGRTHGRTQEGQAFVSKTHVRFVGDVIIYLSVSYGSCNSRLISYDSLDFNDTTSHCGV